VFRSALETVPATREIPTAAIISIEAQKDKTRYALLFLVSSSSIAIATSSSDDLWGRGAIRCGLILVIEQLAMCFTA